MKRKIFLPFTIGIVLLFITWFLYGREQKTKPTAQAWEYKTVMIARRAEGDNSFTYWSENSDGKDIPLPLPVNMTKKLNELGPQGWELISVVTISNSYSPGGDYAGFTNQVNYFLKRPK